MNRTLKLYFIVSVIIGTLIYGAQRLNMELPAIVNNYVNDFLIVPICLTISLTVLRITKNEPHFYLRLHHVLYLAIVYAILFEFILPKYYKRYTPDAVDVVLYMFSAILFYYLQRKS